MTDKAWACGNLLTRFGHEAVIAFFVLSGFCIAHALRHNPSWPNFLGRRFLRLYPAKVGALLWAAFVFLACVWLCPRLFVQTRPFQLDRDFLSLENVARNLAYMPNGHLVGQFWSLPYEMFFYLLAPLLVIKWRRFLTAASILWVLGCFVPVGVIDSWFLLSFTLHYLVLFAMGTAVYHNYPAINACFVRHPGFVWSFVVLAAITEVLLRAKFDNYVVSLDLLTGLVAIGLIQFFCQRQPNTSWMERLGRQSYSLYVTHIATIVLTMVLLNSMGFMQLWEERPYIWPVLIPACLLLAEINYFLFERPSRNYLERTRPAQD